MVTGITEVTQDPEKAGSALKILSLRLRGMKGQLEEMGEEVDENVENISKMQGQVLNMTGGKVNIFDENGDFKSTYEIMDGIAEVWDRLSSIDQATLLETIAGKHRANDVAALISNWNNVESAMQSALDAEGSATKENAKYVDSLQGRLDKLTTAWQAFANSFLDSDFLKSAVSVLTEIVEFLEQIIKHMGTIGTIGLGVGIFSLFKNRSGISGAISYLSSFGSLISEIITSSSKGSAKLKELGSVAAMTGKDIGTSLAGSISKAAGAIGIVVAVIGLAVTAFKNYKAEQAAARQEAIETSNAFLDSANSFEQAYIKYSGRTNLTAEEEAELETAILGTVDALDDKSSALQNAVNSSGDYLASLERIAEAELEAAAAAAKAKRDNAKEELEENAFGWFKADGSEVNVTFNSDDLDEASNEAKKIANEVGGEYVRALASTGKEGNVVINGFKLDENADVDEIVDYYYTLIEYQEALSDADLADTTEYKNVTAAIDTMSDAMSVYVDGVYDAAKAEYQLANGIPKTTEEYLKMREAILKDVGGSVEARKVIASTLDSDYSQIFDLSSAEAQSRQLIGIVDGFGDEHAKEFEVFLNMRSAVNNGECSVSEYMKSLSNIEYAISEFDDEAREEIILAFGLDADTVKQDYDELVGDLTEYMGKEGAEKFAGGLTAGELSVAIDILPEFDLSNTTPEELRSAIEDEYRVSQAMLFTIDIKGETEGIEAFNTALAESRSATGLTAESLAALKARYSDLSSYDAATLFQETANGITVNASAVAALESEYADLQLKDVDTNLSTLKDRYEELGSRIIACDDAASKAELINEREDIRGKIVELAEYATQLEGLTSAYNEWQNAEAAGNDRDMYSNIHSAMEGVGEELELGWIDAGTQEFFQLIWGEDKWSTAGKSIQDYRKQWETLDDKIKGTDYSIQDFFKTNEDGELTSEGIFNFFEAVKQVQGDNDWIQTDEDGNMTSFNFGVDGDAAVAQALGVSEELVQIFLRASQDAGFVVNFDGTYTQLANLQNEAIAANDELKRLGHTDYTFDFDSQSITDLNTQLEEAHKILSNPNFWNTDGTFNFDAEGAEEAMTIVSTLQATIDNLDNSYIGLTVEDAEFEEPLEKLQDYESKVAELNQLKLNPKANAEEIELLEGELDEIATYFHELSEEEKIELGIETTDNIDEIKEKIESGEIQIPTVLDLQTNISESIDDLVDIALLNSGLLTEEQEHEILVKLGIEVDDSEVEETEEEVKHTLTDEQVNANILINYGVDNTEVENYTPEEKQALVNYLLNSDEVDGYTPEQKEAIAQYIADGKELDTWTPEQKEAVASFKVEAGEVDSWTPEQKSAYAKYFKDTSEPDSYKMIPKEGIAKYKKDSTEPDNYQPADKEATVTFWAKIKKKASDLWAYITGDGEVNGTANVNGTAFVEGTIGNSGKAFKRGNWGTEDSGVALMGELGPETIVRDGRFFTVGDSGAGFYQYKKGDIIFNHKQTEELFKNGKVTSGGGRGKALASGTAFSNGIGASNPWKDSTVIETTGDIIVSGSDNSSSSGSSSKPSSSSSSSSSDSADEFLETLDWIEIAINRLERAISRLDLKATSTYRSWTTRNEALADEMGKVSEEIDLQKRAYDRYMQEAASVGLSSSYAAKVRNGQINIEDITNEDLKEKIEEYQKWHEKALGCEDAIDELNEQLSELQKQKFDNIITQFEGLLSVIEHERSMLEEFISQSEAKGYVTSTAYYDALIDNEEANIRKLEEEKAVLLSSLEEGMKNGTIKEGTEAWYEMCQEIDAVTLAIEEGNTAILEYEKTIRELEWEQFDLLQEKISAVTDEAEFLIDLMSNDKLYDDKGQLTDEGMATMGLHGQNYNVHMAQADQYGEEAARLKQQMAEDPFNQDLENRYNEVIELQREHILAAEEEKEAIRDMVEEGIELELDALQELIDAKEEALDAEKDLYEYQKKVAEQTKEIASLEKQMAAYAGDDSEESKAKIQELKVSLEEAKADLEETEYDKYISDQKQLLDELYLEYETILNQRLDNIDALIADMVVQINANSATINETLTEQVSGVGTTLSTEMQSIWHSSDFDDVKNGVKDVITVYGDKFSLAQTTTNETLNTMSLNLQKMITQLNKLAKTDIVAAGTSSAAKSPQANTKPTTTTTTTDKKTTSTTSGGDGTPSIGDKVKFVSGQYYYDSYGSSPLGSQKQGQYVYITNINKKGSHPYHISTGTKLGSGDLGWLKLNQISGYATGKKNFLSDEIAWTQEEGQEFIIRPSDGAILTPIAKNDSVLNAAASNNIWSMANNPADFIKDNLGLDNIDASAIREHYEAYSQNIEQVMINLPNVKNYEELLNALQHDKNFQRLIEAMTLDRIVGKSALAKNKAVR